MAGRPASLDSSLLARKGDATPAIPDDSPLTGSVEEATSDVVPLHRVALPDREPAARAEMASSTVLPAQPDSHWRRAAIILVALLILGLFAVVLADRGNRGEFKPPAPPAQRSEALPQTDMPPQPRTVTQAEAPAQAGAATQPESAMPPAPAALPPKVAETPAGAAPEPAVPAPAVASVPSVPSETAAPPRLPLTVAPPAAGESGEKPKAVTPALAPAAPVSRPVSRYVLQFASVRDERRAFQEAARLQKRIGGSLSGRKIKVVNSEVGGRLRYRLRVAGYATLREALAACRQVARLKVDCLPIRR